MNKTENFNDKCFNCKYMRRGTGLCNSKFYCRNEKSTECWTQVFFDDSCDSYVNELDDSDE